MATTVPLPRPRPATVIPIPRPRPLPKTQQQNFGVGKPVRRTPTAPARRTQATGYGALRDPLANADPHNEVAAVTTPVGMQSAADVYDPAFALAISRRLQATIDIRTANSPFAAGVQSYDPLAVLKAQFEVGFSPQSRPMETQRALAMAAYKQWESMGRIGPPPPVIDPYNELINSSLVYNDPDHTDNWETYRAAESLNSLRQQLGVTPAPRPPVTVAAVPPVEIP